MIFKLVRHEWFEFHLVENIALEIDARGDFRNRKPGRRRG
jgi:hypothetical protein